MCFATQLDLNTVVQQLRNDQTVVCHKQIVKTLSDFCGQIKTLYGFQNTVFNSKKNDNHQILTMYWVRCSELAVNKMTGQVTIRRVGGTRLKSNGCSFIGLYCKLQRTKHCTVRTVTLGGGEWGWGWFACLLYLYRMKWQEMTQFPACIVQQSANNTIKFLASHPSCTAEPEHLNQSDHHHYH